MTEEMKVPTTETDVEKCALQAIDNQSLSPTPLLVKSQRTNSKLILQNMEEVLHLVRKKHRAKHKRKREMKRLAQMAELNNAKLNHTENGTLLNHFTSTTKKKEESSTSSSASSTSSSQSPSPLTTTNAFELMMNARVKTTTPTTTMPIEEANTVTPTAAAVTTTTTPAAKRSSKRKSAANKRKLEEVEVEEIKMPQDKSEQQNAKRLRNRLIDDEDDGDDDVVVVVDDGMHETTTTNRRSSRRNIENHKMAVEVVVQAEKEEEELYSSRLRKSTKISSPLQILQNSPSCSSSSSKTSKKQQTKKQQRKPIKEDVTIISDNNVDIINLDNVEEEEETPRKLAPLFCRQKALSSPMKMIDMHAKKARHEFLHSGVPDKIRLEQTRQKQVNNHYEELWQLFPTISHIRQISSTPTPPSPRSSIKLKNIDFDENLILNFFNDKHFIIKTDCRQQQHLAIFEKCQNNVPLHTIDCKRLIVKAWKNQNERFPTYKCYNQLRERHRYFSMIDTTKSQHTQQYSESFMVTSVAANINTLRSNFIADDCLLNSTNTTTAAATTTNGDLLFTEKYKPLLFEQVLVNLTPVVQLRDFLINYNNKKSNGDSDDADEFELVNDNNSSCSSSRNLNNTVVLLGPHASGKTNAVFALANELNFNVLEINAGMKRNGKRLVQDLQEATQSHQIHKERIKSQLLQYSINNAERKTY